MVGEGWQIWAACTPCNLTEGCFCYSAAALGPVLPKVASGAGASVFARAPRLYAMTSVYEMIVCIGGAGCREAVGRQRSQPMSG